MRYLAWNRKKTHTQEPARSNRHVHPIFISPSAVENAPVVAKALFDQPVSVEAVELPLRDEAGVSLPERAATFYRLLKTHVFGRFLGLQRTTIASG